MKIAEIQTYIVANRFPGRGGPYFPIVKLATDTGATGIGEIYAASFSADRIADLAVDTAERHLIGEDPFRVERLWRTVYTSGYSGRPDPTLVGVLSGLEMACWDIIGKETNRPVHDLLGGRVHERLRTYTYIYPSEELPDVYTDPEQSAERALQYVDMGFTAVKLDPARRYTIFDGRQPSLHELDSIESFVRTVREAIGNRADILIGTHGQFTASGALRVAARLEPYDPLWFEEPTPPDAIHEMAKVAAGTSVPIATGERLTTKHEFARLLEADAAAILQPNLGRAGGLLEGKKIATLAEVHGAQIAPHLYSGPVLGAANAQLCACTPNFLMMEGIEDWTGFHADLLQTPLVWDTGYLEIPRGPGLGVVLDETVAQANPYTGDALHITPDPVL